MKEYSVGDGDLPFCRHCMCQFNADEASLDLWIQSRLASSIMR